MQTMEAGIAVFLVGTWGFLGLLSWVSRNWAALIALSLAVIAALFSGLLNIGLELHWMLVAGTCMLLVAGMIVRWIES